MSAEDFKQMVTPCDDPFPVNSDTQPTPAPTPRTDWVEARVWDRYKQAEDITPKDNARAAIREACEHASTLERELTSAQAALAAKDAEIKRLQEFELDVTCIGRDVHDYCQDLKADRTRRLPTLVLTMIGNLRARAEKAEQQAREAAAELAQMKQIAAERLEWHTESRRERDALRAEVERLNSLPELYDLLRSVEERKVRCVRRRALFDALGQGSFGIAVGQDEAAMEWQKLDAEQNSIKERIAAARAGTANKAQP